MRRKLNSQSSNDNIKVIAEVLPNLFKKNGGIIPLIDAYMYVSRLLATNEINPRILLQEGTDLLHRRIHGCLQFSQVWAASHAVSQLWGHQVASPCVGYPLFVNLPAYVPSFPVQEYKESNMKQKVKSALKNKQDGVTSFILSTEMNIPLPIIEHYLNVCSSICSWFSSCMRRTETLSRSTHSMANSILTTSLRHVLLWTSSKLFWFCFVFYQLNKQ